MTQPENIRWKQRFQNFEKSFLLLKKSLLSDNKNIVYRAGIIQFFEISFELAWKMIKDYLEHQGFIDIKTPRDTIKKAFETGLISDGEIWLQALTDRNLTTHTYEEETAVEVDLLIRNKYSNILNELYDKLKSEL
jgi:nucleotidyltransferase substrate binding protein (TIGR01987 family)